MLEPLLGGPCRGLFLDWTGRFEPVLKGRICSLLVAKATSAPGRGGMQKPVLSCLPDGGFCVNLMHKTGGIAGHYAKTRFRETVP